MFLFLIAVVVAVLGVGAYAHYNPGAHDVNLRNMQFTAVPDWMPLAAAAGVILFFFLLQALYSSARIRMLRRRAAERPRPATASRPLQSMNR